MNNLNQNMPVHNNSNESTVRFTGKDYPSEVEEMYQQDSQHLIPEMACGSTKERSPLLQHKRTRHKWS